MILKLLFIAVFVAAFIFLIIFFLNGLVPSTQPPGLNLSVSENISSGVNVFVLDQLRNVIKSVETNERFFPQQKGLPEGTVYGFRVVDKEGDVSLPVYETFTANAPDWTGWN